MATDGSPGGNRAVDTAARLAKAVGSELVILTVGGNNITGAELRRLAATDGDVSETLESALNQVLKQAQKRAQRIGVAAPKLQNGWGDPAETIIDTVRREKANIACCRQARPRPSFWSAARQRLAEIGEPGAVCRDRGSLVIPRCWVTWPVTGGR